ncbi:MAG: hypothetical protein ACKVVO_03710 [Opitutaceae bacterium]
MSTNTGSASIVVVDFAAGAGAARLCSEPVIGERQRGPHRLLRASEHYQHFIFTRLHTTLRQENSRYP